MLSIKHQTESFIMDFPFDQHKNELYYSILKFKHSQIKKEVSLRVAVNEIIILLLF